MSQSRQLINQEAQEQQSYQFDGLAKWQFYAYGVGHFMNDLGGAIYFNYLFYFLKRIVNTEWAPLAFLAGQITDGICTPLIGFLSDKTNTKYGQRKPWYIGGFIIFLLGYFPIYQNIKQLRPNCTKSFEGFYYIFFLCLVNIGWAAVQISHMSLVPSLTCSRKRRDQLNIIRNAFTFLSNLLILSLGTILFATMSNSTLQINLLSYVGGFLGISAGLFFIIGIDEQRLTKKAAQKAKQLKMILDSEMNINNETQRIDQEDKNLEKSQIKIQNWTYWFKKPSFYIFGLCYMSVRLYVNLFGTLLPFYLIDVLGFGTSEQISNGIIPFQVALVALTIYCFQFITSTLMTKIYSKFGRKRALFVGTVLCFITSFSMIFLNPHVKLIMYFIAIFVGISQTLVLSTGINLISDVIGTQGKQGAFVFGIYGLLDKFSSGLAIYFITNGKIFEQSIIFKKWMAVVMPSLACIISCTIVLLVPVAQYTQKNETKSILKQSKLSQQLVYD